MEKLLFALERIYRMTHIPVRLFDKTSGICLLSRGYEEALDPIVCDSALRAAFIEKAVNEKFPLLEYEEHYIYGICADLQSNVAIVGPITTKAVGIAQLDTYRSAHKVNAAEGFFIKRRTADELCAVLAMLINVATGRFISEFDIFTNHKENSKESDNERRDNERLEYALDFAENENDTDAPRFGFSEEIKFAQFIKEGNLGAIRAFAENKLPTFYDLQVGKLSERSFKQSEYMACSAIILASRAAIEGGLDALASYLLSDIYFQRLEKCATISEVYKLTREMSESFAERVMEKKISRSKSSYVEQAKAFVYNHLNKTFTIDEIADTIVINKSYLCRKFSEAEGMGIQQYAQKRRIEASANMLKFSDMSILTIANYLRFTSQSHFTRVFKEQMGTTPQKYRENNKPIDF